MGSVVARSSEGLVPVNPVSKIPGVIVPGFKVPWFSVPGVIVSGFNVPGFEVPGAIFSRFNVPGFIVPGFVSPSNVAVLFSSFFEAFCWWALPYVWSLSCTEELKYFSQMSHLCN